jgi:hypothetical protein
MNTRGSLSDRSVVLPSPPVAVAESPSRNDGPHLKDRDTSRGQDLGALGVSFRLPANREIGRANGVDCLSRLLDVFAPSSPVLNPAYYIGRTKQIEQLIDAIEEHRNHALVFGPRGCGKTSLALTLLSAAKQANYTTIYLSCSRSSTFETLFRPVLAKLPRRFDIAASGTDLAANATFEDLLQGEVNPQLVGQLLARVAGARVLIVLDEFDLQSSKAVTTEVVELMKSLSDQAAPVHLLLIGVGGTSDDLLGRQASIPRSLFKMKLGHMSDQETETVISRLMTLCGLQITAEALKEVVAASGGKLFVAKLMALRAAKQAVLVNARLIEAGDFSAVTAGLCEHFNSEGLTALHEVIAKNPSLQFVLRALLRTVREVGDEFTAEQVYARYAYHGDLNRITAQRFEAILQSLTEMGNVLVEIPRNGTKAFRFVDPNIELAIAIGGYRASSETARRVLSQ